MHEEHLEISAKALSKLANQILAISKQITEEEMGALDKNLIGNIKGLNDGAENMVSVVNEFLAILPSLEHISTHQLASYLTKVRHDLRNPINAIKGYGEFCIEELMETKNEKNLGIASKLEPIPSIANEMLKVTERIREEFPLAMSSRDMAIMPPNSIGTFSDIPSISKLIPMQGKILIVDDTESNRRLLELWLKRKNYVTQTAKSGHEALALLDKDSQFDIVLLDIMMPDLDGIEVLKRIKSNERLSNLIVIMISAIDEMDSVVLCIKLGAVDYLIKPFDFYLLDARVTAGLQNKLFVAMYQERLITNGKLAALGNITAGIAHEIRNPLNSVINFSELSSMSANNLDLFFKKNTPNLSEENKIFLNETLETLKSNLEIVIKQSKQADEIIQRMFGLSTISTSTERFTTTDINQLINTAFKVACNSYGSEINDFKINFTTHFESNYINTEVIQEEIFFVLINIFNNAFFSLLQKKEMCDFLPTVTVSTKKIMDNKIEIEITDNGIGISDDDKLKLFTPFFTTKPPGKGVGLGLSLSHNIITQLHKGSLNIVSKENEYTKLSIVIPIKHY